MRVLVGLVAGVIACSSPDDKTGEVGAACYPNGTCNVGLSCFSGTCVPADAALPVDAAVDAMIDAVVIDAPFVCIDDAALEGATRNDTYTTATPTPVASSSTMATFVAGICTSGDIDAYRVDIVLTGQNLVTSVTWEPGPSLALSILNGQGTPIANASPSGPNSVAVTAANLPTGAYIVETYANPSGTKNNYSLSLEVTGP